MIDENGFRPNVGIILCNRHDRVLWAHRAQHDSWQFPQGGIKSYETALQAVYRELREEVGLRSAHVEMLGATHNWLHYKLPKRYLRYRNKPLCVGQKQRWFLLRLIGDEENISLNIDKNPEFNDWCWVDYWKPIKDIVFFKRRVYEKALHELSPLLFSKYKKLNLRNNY